MPTVTYLPEAGRPAEHVEAETMTVEGGHVVLRQTVLVMGRPQVVVRRLRSSEIDSVTG